MLEVESLSFAYFPGQEILKGISLRVNPGEIYGLLGSNGAGKSTLLACIAGFLPFASGCIRVGGVSLKEDPAAARKGLVYLPENVALWDRLTALELVAIFADLLGLEHSDRRPLRPWGLPEEVWGRAVGTFSKGMRQRLALTLLTMRRPKVALLDEPTSGLDPQATEAMLAQLVALAQGGTAVLVVSHDTFRVGSICHRVGVLWDGQVQEVQDMRDLFRGRTPP